MDESILLNKQYTTEGSVSIEVSVVTGYKNDSHTHAYRVFELTPPDPEARFIGVNDNDLFALAMKPHFKGRFAAAVYLDGVNACQVKCIISLSDIEEEDREEYAWHQGQFICENDDTIAYLYRYHQKDNRNDLFRFTTSADKGINETLLSEPSLEGRIDIYLWKEKIIGMGPDVFLANANYASFSHGGRTKVGAGASTGKIYLGATHLENPVFLGKATFMHVNADRFAHFGDTKIAVDMQKKINRVT